MRKLLVAIIGGSALAVPILTFSGLALPPDWVMILAVGVFALAMGLTAVYLLRDMTRARLAQVIRTALPQIREALFVIDNQGDIRYASPGALELLGSGALTGRNVNDIIPDMRHQKWADIVADLDGEVTRVRDTEYLKTDGSVIPVHEEMGSLQFVYRNWAFILARDITAQIAQQEELTEAVAEAEQANRAKSAFLANMSHEIRTPLAAILGYADIMLRPGILDEKTGGIAAQVRSNATYLLEVVDDILDLSRVEAGAVEITIEDTEMRNLIGDVVSPLLHRARAQGIRLSASLGTPVPEVVKLDEKRLKQILINLVTNAIKFTPEGYVELTVSCKPIDDTSVRLRFSVIDSGIGIAPNQLQELFNPFQRVHGRGMREIEGSGLGLSIAQRLANLMQSQIEVSSEVGIGSVFSLSLETEVSGNAVLHEIDALPQTAMRASKESLPRLDRTHVLVVDDNPHNQDIEKCFIEDAGGSVDIAANGYETIQKLGSEHAAQYDVVLLDMQLPDRDGYSIAAEVRGMGVKTPIVAVTAYAMTGDREKCLAAGCDEYLSKPVTRGDLVRMVNRFSAQKSVSTKTAKQAPAKPKSENPFVILQRRYVAKLGTTMQEMSAALDKGDFGTLETMAHKLKGSAGSYDFDKLGQAAAAFEQTLMRDVSDEETRLALQSLQHEARMVERQFPEMLEQDSNT